MPGMSGMEVLDHIRAFDPESSRDRHHGLCHSGISRGGDEEGGLRFHPQTFHSRPTPHRRQEGRWRGEPSRKKRSFCGENGRSPFGILPRRKSKIKTIINCMGDGVLVSDRDSCIVLSNPAASRMLKAPETCLVGNNLNQCNLPPELSKTMEESLQAKDRSYASVSQELSVGESGDIFLRAHTAPVRNDIGETMGSVTVLQDISHLKELDKMKSEFIAMVTHELRAPIAAVEQQLTVILNKMAGEVTEKQEQLLSRAKQRTRGLLDLIKDLLDLSKIEAGKMVQYKEPLLLREVIQRVVDLMRAEAENKKIDLEFSIPSRVIFNQCRSK